DSLVAGKPLGAKIRATGSLQQIAADRRHVAYLSAGAGQDRACDQRMMSCHVGMGGDIAQPGKRPQREPSVDKLHMIQRQTRDVDDRFGGRRARLPELEQVGSASQERGAWSRRLDEGVVYVHRAAVLKRRSAHNPATSAIAA